MTGGDTKLNVAPLSGRMKRNVPNKCKEVKFCKTKRDKAFRLMYRNHFFPNSLLDVNTTNQSLYFHPGCSAPCIITNVAVYLTSPQRALEIAAGCVCVKCSLVVINVGFVL